MKNIAYVARRSDVPDLNTALLLMTKLFYIGEPVTAEENTDAKMYTKVTLWIGSIPFPSLDEAWGYMLSVPDQSQRLEVAEDVAHQHVLLAEKMGYENQNMTRLSKRDWKSVGMAKETMTDLIVRLQPYVTALNKAPGYRASTLLAITKYCGQALYERF